MSQLFLSAVGLALTAAVMAGLLRALGWKGVPVYISITVLAVFSLFSEVLLQVISEVISVGELGGVSKYAEAALKILAVGLTSGVVCDTLSELGESGLSRAITVAARLETVAIFLPFFREIIDTGLEFLS